MKRIREIILGILLLVVTGCQGRFPEITSEGKIEGYIRDIMTNEPIAVSQVQIIDILGSTDGDGYFTLYRETNNEDEMYLIPNSSGNSYSIKKAGYYSKKGITMLKYGQKNLLGYLAPMPSATRYVVTGKVTSKLNGYIENATVVINTPFDSESFKYEVKTNINGSFEISDVPEGKINIYIYKDGYEPFSKIINLNRNWMDDIITITENSSKKYGDICGNVSDVKGNFCDNAKISIGQENSGYYQFTMADTNGNYIIKGVPAGDAQLTVKAPGFYKENTKKVTVSAGAITYDNNIVMQYLDYAE